MKTIIARIDQRVNEQQLQIIDKPSGAYLLSKSNLAVAIALLTGSLGAVSPALAVPPTLRAASPLFGSQPFSARMVLFEEFGLQDYDGTEDPNKMTLPRPVDPVTGQVDCSGNTNDSGLDAIINNTKLYPIATEYALTDVNPDGSYKYTNPWKPDVQTCDPTYGNVEMPMDGRPGAGDFKHQRWNETRTIHGVAKLEFQPTKFFQAVQAGARTGGGARDKLQMHGYAHKLDSQGNILKFSEFGPGGLYHNTVTGPYASGGPLANTPGVLPEDAKISYVKDFEGTTKGIPVKIDPLNPDMPVQDRNSVWTYDGTIPPKLLMARYGETILFRHHNALPIDIAATNGFGTHTISTHEHNGHNPAESDGFAGAFFFPGQHYDYRWPMTLAGHDSINTGATDKRAATPCSATETSVGIFPCVTDPFSGSRTANVPGDYRELMGTHWFHDHMLDFTAQNVYKGNAAAMNYYSAIDRGNEEINDGVNLRFPSGTAREWGNRDYDVNLVLGDKAFDQSGQLFFDPLITDGFLGDVPVVNWVFKPFMDVRARKYRFRMLNGSVSRYFKVAVAYADPKTGAPVQLPIHMIANDGNLLKHAIAFPNTEGGEGLPVQAIAERIDYIIDFSKVPGGVKKVYLVNLMEHASGTGPLVKPQTLAAAWNAQDKTVKTAYIGNDLVIGKFMEFRIRPMAPGQVDNSMNPATFVEKLVTTSVTTTDPKTKKKTTVTSTTDVGKNLIELPTFTEAELATAKHRTFNYGRLPGVVTDGNPWGIEVDGVGGTLAAKIDRVSAAPAKGSVEIWHLINNSAGWSHPAHVHFEEGQIITRNGVTPPAWERLGRKDMYRLGPELHSGNVDVAIRVRDWNGTYVEHCHNTQHEDHAMLIRWDVENPDHLTTVRTPYPEWNGVVYDDVRYGQTFKVPTADTGSTTTGEAKTFKVPAGGLNR